MPSLVGTKIDKYDVLDEVGHGGMAVVYRGRDTVLDREVAVKVLHSHLSDREESRLRLQREAITVANLRHENILEIFDYSGPDAGESYIVTEFIHGPTLKEWMDESHAPRPTIAAMIVHRLCGALSHAHRGGVVHRDIKPENVMIRKDDGCLKLMDFGIAQILDKQKLTLTGQLLGSPAYMAPELISGQPLDKRTDLFSLGILLYQLATGKLPFAGRNPHEVLNRIADGEYPAPSSHNPMVDNDLEEIIRKALSTKPDERYQTAEALASDLGEYLAEVGVEPNTAEITRYFQDPNAYVDELDGRVSQALMERAQTAIKDGYNARAIRLLGRVLELEPSHPEAKASLARLRTRARRTRQLLVAGGVLATVGMVAAAVILFEPEPEPVTRGILGAAEDRAPEDPPPPDSPKKTESPLPGLGKAPPKPAADTKAAETASRPPRNSYRPVAAVRVASCTLKLQGVAEPTAQNLSLTVGGKKQKIEKLEVPIRFKEPQTKVKITGNHTGTRTITREECKKDATLELTLAPKPARLRFTKQPPQLVIQCLAGCPDAQRNYNASTFPAIAFRSGESEKHLKLLFKSGSGEYKPDTRRVRVFPGSNEIDASLDPR